MGRNKSPSQAVGRLLPSVEAATQAGVLPPHDVPLESRPLCALVVHARVLERSQWREEKVLRWRWAKRMGRGALPISGQPTSHFVTALEETFETIPCQKCRARQLKQDAFAACPACGVRARILHTSDTISVMVETYLPRQISARPLMFGFEAMLARRTTPQGKPPPDALQCHDLKPRRVGGAYRAAKTTKKPTFHGHDFGNTIALATKAIELFFLGKEVSRYDIRAWAWPFIWLRYGSDDDPVERALFVDRQGKLDVFVGG